MQTLAKNREQWKKEEDLYIGDMKELRIGLVLLAHLC